MARRPKPVEPRLISSRLMYKGPLFQVATDHVLDPGGIKVRRDIVRHRGSVVVLPVDNSGKDLRVLLVRQYRHAAGQFLWELPAGGIDAGESALEGAKRELIEETGYTSETWKRALFFWPSPGFLAESMTIYMALGLKRGKAQPEADEFISKRLFPIRALVKQILAGKILDAKTIAGVLWLDRMAREGRVGKTRAGIRPASAKHLTGKLP